MVGRITRKVVSRMSDNRDSTVSIIAIYCCYHYIIFYNMYINNILHVQYACRCTGTPEKCLNSQSKTCIIRVKVNIFNRLFHIVNILNDALFY